VRKAGVSRAGLVALSLIATALFAQSAGAQNRPSLSRIETYLCTAADENGESFRPVFCSPRCDCITGTVPAAATCEQAPSGVVEVEAPRAPTTTGSCYGQCLQGPFLCTSNADCLGVGNSCAFLSLPSLCLDLDGPDCQSDAQCDQAKGYSCEFNLTTTSTHAKICTKASSCSAPGPCDSGIQSFDFNMDIEFQPAPDPTPLSCSGGTPAQFHGNLNSTDVALCLAQVEAAIGAGVCIICGDGNLDTGEQCDDGNLAAGDGCDASCQTE